MSNEQEMREAFEAWLYPGNGCGCNESMWKAWQAATLAAEARIRELEAAEKDVYRLVTALKDVVGVHDAPNNCYSTGPMTGDPFYDLVRCPSCCALSLISEIENKRVLDAALTEHKENQG